MVTFKIYYHLMAFVWKLYYLIIYGRQLQIGKRLQFRKGFSLLIDDTGGVKIGNDVFFNNYCSVCAMNFVSIGDGTIFGENVKIYDHNHIYKDISIPIKIQGYTSAPITIGKHCWMGSNVTILKGVTIGDNCVIGAGCVIHKDVPPNSIVVNKQELVLNQNSIS